jgi:hypothetical protein
MPSRVRKSDGSYINSADLAVEADAIADIGALTSAQITGGESPTEAEFNALQADVATIRTKVNAILAELRQGGAIASS